MKFTVIINNYNYGRYLQEAIDSVLAQSHGDFELIIVDDGSTDEHSHRVLDAVSDNRIRVMRKHNGGQLSCFNAAWFAARGDIITFLDADDRYKDHHLETLAQAAAEHPDVDFFATSMEFFGNKQGTWRFSEDDRLIASCAARTWFFGRWYGQPTSALAIRSHLLDRFMPIPLESDWRYRADACLIHCCSLAGASKLFLREITVDYRRHDNNDSSRRLNDRHEQARHRLRIRRLFQWIRRHQGLENDDFRKMIYPEYMAEPRLTALHCKDLLRLFLRTAPLTTSLIVLSRMRLFLKRTIMQTVNKHAG
ncbi:glycosyltransferase involved in cell wall biosynthesis [Methylohalomonas lacus]|uniref:Glycosyltransferase involved in cell wall biosynthesis n=1 Tax=Methylohalomonas lacus TaxID=398773 RepID=A0AAE3L4S9_9GAMM|nr:glycosyltransferase [Methylohalomonas lacus]MCS3904388.1 glycosyltransferase involved in cell wall biosynthesis [Methylohalomonas lacus]